MDPGEGHTIGRRVREIRVWRGMSLKQVADLAGISEGYLSRIERGVRGVHRRSLLEALASALRVAPSELAEQAFPPAAADPVTGEAQAAVIALEAALSDLDLDNGNGATTSRPWPEVAADMNRLNGQLRPATDYAAQGAVLPGLLAELHTLYASDPANRVNVLRALMDCYHASGVLLKNMGVRGLPTLAAFHARRVAEELGDPAWLGLAAWLRASTLGGKGRARMLELSERASDDLQGHLGDPRALQMYGALHLNAALASAAMGRNNAAVDHLDEAGSIAARIGADGGRGFGNLYFGPDNVGIWRVSIAVELGEDGRAREIAQSVVPSRVPSAARQAMYWADLGRGMAQGRATRDEAIGALLRAEKIAPQRIRTNPFVRETVGDLMRRTRREAGGRELRGMAYRMGLAVG